MPILSRWFIKTGLVYFLLALLSGIALKAQSEFPFLSFLTYFTPVYYHLLMIGWITQIIMGVSYWMFPRYSKEKPRGHELLGWLAFFSINAGLILRSFSEPLVLSNPTFLLKTAVVFAAILQLAGGLFYIALIWSRVKGKGEN